MTWRWNMAVMLLAATGLLTQCDKPASNKLQGYVEGEFVYVAAPSGGRLEKLALAKASLEDSKKGKRPSEMASLQAQLLQASAALTLAKETLSRQEKLAKTGANAVDDLDRARSNHDQSLQRVTQIEADLQ